MARLQFEQGAMDTLVHAKEAIERAIVDYERCQYEDKELSIQEGPLFATLDCIDSAINELEMIANVIFPHCNREACRKPGANCKHSQTGEYYCRACAVRINHQNAGEVKNLIDIPTSLLY